MTLTPLRRSLLALLLACNLNAGAAVRPPIEDFFSNAPFTDAVLSPSGRYLAALTGSQDGRDRLAVVDLSDNSGLVVAQFPDTDIGRFQWVNDQRLLFSTVDKSLGQRDMRYGPGLFAVNRDGKAYRQLAKRQGAAFIRNGDDERQLLPWHTFLLDQAGPQDSDSVYVVNGNVVPPGRLQSSELLRLNTLNGRTLEVDHPGEAQSWLLDHKGVPRLVSTLEQNLLTIRYLDPANEQWRTLATFDAYTGGAQSFQPLAFGPDGSLYVVSSTGRDTRALYRYDLARNRIDERPLVELEGYDFHGQLILSDGKLLGVRARTDGEITVWLDPAMKTLQETVDRKLPGTANLITPPARPTSPWVLVVAYSDRQPRKYLVYNTATKRMSEVGNVAPRIKPAEMGSSELLHYAARDGLDIPAWLTLPPSGNGKNLPLVVLVHGGPYVRGSDWGWHAEVQFLASRGYAVLEPEFRGSTGFGDKHFRAGWKQWGLKMQDDLADGARWAIAQSIADPKRICIAGASYGGYATLMGLVNDPGLYKCGIDWVGVTDINLMYDGSWRYASDLSEDWKRYGMPQLIGDQVRDAAQLKATSPLQQAGRIKQPLLLAYGGADLRVPLNHGLKFYDAVKAGNPDVEWVLYPEEGHGWHLPKNRIDFWGRVEAFLARQLGQP